MSPVGWQFLIFWMTLVAYPKMTATPSPHVSEFAYVPRIHPSRNPACRSRYTGDIKNPSDHGLDQPSIEVRAVLAPCLIFSVDKAFNIKDKKLNNREERSSEDDRWTIKNCTQKIVINMKLNNIGPTDTRDKFVVIDHAVDPATMKKFPLQNPYVIKLRQEPVLQLYGLEFKSWLEGTLVYRSGAYQCLISGEAYRRVAVLSIDDQVPAERLQSRDFAGKIIDRETLNKVVNAEAWEDVINNETPNFRGCSVDNENPTCGQAIMRGEPVPFSQGFCCSCDPKIKPVSNASFASAKSLPVHPTTSSNGANKPCNRLLSASGRANSDSDPMARSQAIETNVQSRGKSNMSENLPCKTSLSLSELVQDAQKRRRGSSKNNQDEVQAFSSSPKDNVEPCYKSKNQSEQIYTDDKSTPKSTWSSTTAGISPEVHKTVATETAQNPSAEPKIEAKIILVSPGDAVEVEGRPKITTNVKDRAKIAAEPRTKQKYSTGSSEDVAEVKDGVKIEDFGKIATNVEGRAKIAAEPRTKLKHSTGSSEDPAEEKDGVKIEDLGKIATNVEGRAKIVAEPRIKQKHSTGSSEDAAEEKDGIKIEDLGEMATNVEGRAKIVAEPRTKQKYSTGSIEDDAEGRAKIVAEPRIKLKHSTGSSKDPAEVEDGVKIEDLGKMATNVEGRAKIVAEPRTKQKHSTGSSEDAAEVKDGVEVHDLGKIATNVESRAKIVVEPKTKVQHATGSPEDAAEDGVKTAAEVEDREKIAEDQTFQRSLEENMIPHGEETAHSLGNAMQIKSTPRRDEKSLSKFQAKKSAKRTNQPVIRLESPFRSKQMVGKKLAGRRRSSSGTTEGLEDPKGCKKCYGIPFLRNRGWVGAKRNKAEEDGVLNSDRSSTGPSGSRSGNLNSVMEAGQPDIIAGSFNEKHEDGYFQSDGNEGDTGLGRFARMTPTLEENVSMLREEVIENYTPQKRTLKDVSYKEYDGEKIKKIRTNGAKRCRRYLKHKQRNSGKNGGWKGRKMLKRRRGQGKVEEKREAAHQTIQVYVDLARTFPLLTSTTSPKSAINATTIFGTSSSEKNGVKPEPGPPNEANRQDSVDKQIEEKFSRISDALKEDATVLESTSTSTSPPPLPSEPSSEATSERSISQGPGNKFNEPNDVFRQRNNEAGEDGAGNGNELEENLPESTDQPVDDYGGANKNLNPYLVPERGNEGARLIPSRFTGLMDSSSTTLDLLIPVPEVSSSAGAILFPTATAKDSELTNAVIVVDVFEIATGPLDTLTTLKETVSPDQLAKRINKQSLMQSSTFKPVGSTFSLTERTTIFLMESTTVTAVENNTAETTNAKTTLITDPAFRPSIKPFEDPASATDLEFNNEVSLDETTLADETERPTTVRGLGASISSNANPVRRNRKTWMGFPGRKKRRTTPSMIKTKDLSVRGTGCRPGLSRVNPGYYGRKKSPESAMKFFLETREVNMMKKKVDDTGRILHEQRNYVQLSVDGSGGQTSGDLSEEHRPRRKYRENADRNTLEHPWILTTESVEFTVRPDDSFHKGKNKHRARNSDLETKVGEVTGRILSPCTGENEKGLVQGRGCEMRMHQRRLMSVQDVERVECHWLKDGKNCVENGDDGTSEEQDTCEGKLYHRRLLSVQSPKLSKHLAKDEANKIHDHPNDSHLINDRDAESDDTVKSSQAKSPQKSKKRDTIQKQKKSASKRSSKQQASSSADSVDTNDYPSPEDKEYDDETLTEERQPKDPEEEEGQLNNPEDLGMDYENDSPEETSNQDASGVSENLQDDSYNLIDVPIPVHLDKLSEKLKIESQARSDRSSIDGENAGKDFEISLTGKIHLNNDEFGRPMSVSFDAAGSPGKDFAPEGLASYRSPESASSFIDGTDTLAADNANFLPGGFNSAPFDNVEDRSSRRDHYLRPIRDRMLNSERGRQRLLRLRKKSAEASQNRESRLVRPWTGSRINEAAVNENLKSLVKYEGSSRLGQEASLVAEESEARDRASNEARINGAAVNEDLKSLEKDTGSSRLGQEAGLVPEESQVRDDELSSDSEGNEDLNSLVEDPGSSGLGQDASLVPEEPEAKDDEQSADFEETEPVDVGDQSRRDNLPSSDDHNCQKVLHLQKKSAILNLENEPAKSENALENNEAATNEDLKNVMKDSSSSSLGQGPSQVPQELEVNDAKQSPNVNSDEPGVEDPSSGSYVMPSGEVFSKEMLGNLLGNAPQVALDFGNVPGQGGSGLEGDSDLGDHLKPITIRINTSQCEDSDCTTLKIDLVEVKTTLEYSTEPGTTVTEVKVHSKGTEGGAETTATQIEVADTLITTQEDLATESAAAFQVSKNESDHSIERDESTQKENMLEVSDLIKRLESLVTDAGNSSNDTGHTLVHLKKFIIVPDNRTMWSVREFSEPKPKTMKDVPLVGSKVDKSLREEEGSESDNSDLIKEIISSVIRGDNLKRDVSSSRSCSKANCQKSDGQCDGRSCSKVSRRDSTSSNNLEHQASLKKKDIQTSSKIEDSMLKDDSSKNVDKLVSSLETSKKDEVLKRSSIPSNDLEHPEASMEKNFETKIENSMLKDDSSKNVDVPVSSLGTSMESSKKEDEICRQGKPNGKRKRDVSRGDANSPSDKGKRHARHAKRRRRRRRKMKKKKKGARIKKEHNSRGSKWPFKRNLLMLSEDLEDGSERKEKKGRQHIRKARDGNMLKEPQTRGGQDCGDHRYPPDVDPFGYLQSAHCLRFSELWYSVYQLDQPVIDHKLHLQIYEKRTKADGSIYWKDLATESLIRLGTLDRNYRNPEGTMALVYNDVEVKKSRFDLDHKNDRLLVPSSLSGKGAQGDQAWLGEYLVLQASEINENGDECDKAGVGYAAFVKQPDRCEHVRGTCLKNQPLAYWRHDTEARDSGQAGCYFLSNFAGVPAEAIKYNANGTGSREFLGLEYYSPHVSVIDVELTADYNALLRPGSFGRLTEVYSYNTGSDYTVITALITNKGSYSSSYRLRITDCPEGAPSSWSAAESPMRIISPHRDRKTSLDLYGRLSLKEFSCSVALLNRDGEPVASRQIKVRKMDRCFCVRHCKCSCEGNAHGNGCEPMSLENYHAAGFHGTIPSMTYDFFAHYSPANVICLFLIALLFLLILMGFLKWMVGLCVPTVSRWGLDAIVDSSQMKSYFEKDLASRPVVFDQYGTPIHPDTQQQTVRVCSSKLEFLLNLIFFFIYPFASCQWRCKRNCQPRNQAESSVNIELKPLPTSSEEDPSETVCVSTYGDSVNSNLEAEDTRYVIDELKKSQESLRNHCRYKRDSDSHRSSSD